jgi:hypothetical protein
MRIIVVSDTHMPRMAKKLPVRLVQELRNADVILHAGDWTDIAVWHQLCTFAPVVGVAGNNDGDELVSLLGYRKIIRLGDCHIGLVHGHGPSGRHKTEDQAMAEFAHDSVEAIVFGHSHVPVSRKTDNGVLLFNPGSPTDKRRQSRYSFGVLEIEGRSLRARHIYYEDKNG